MEEKPPQVFISYARDDNRPPPGQEHLPGFVTALQDYLFYEMQQLGQWRPTLWRDRHGIDDADQFANLIVKEINLSDFLLVVMSNNWYGRSWCLKELEAFCERWGNSASPRCIVVNKSLVDPVRRPEALQGQKGYDFFEIEQGGERNGRERPFFSFGKPQDGFELRVRDLARRLYNAAQPVGSEVQERPYPTPALNGRTVFIARPASDMRSGYARVAAELAGRGFVVVPEVEIPHDRSAVSFIDHAMDTAEISVHLIGEFKGYAPDEEEPIAKLQLARARKAANARPEFKRIVWVPKLFKAEDAEAAVAREPLETLEKFDASVEGDKIFGGELSDFVEFLVRDLLVNAPRIAAPVADAGKKQTILIVHNARDTDSAVSFGRALQQADMAPTFAASEGTATQVGAYNQKRFRECDQVLVYWANAKEGWALAQAAVLSEWQSSERKRKGLVAAPPNTDRKRLRVAFPPDEVDFVVDMTMTGEIGPEHLATLARGKKVSGDGR